MQTLKAMKKVTSDENKKSEVSELFRLKSELEEMTHFANGYKQRAERAQRELYILRHKLQKLSILVNRHKNHAERATRALGTAHAVLAHIVE